MLRRLVVPCAVAATLLVAAPAMANAKIPLGYYQCYQTNRDVSPINGEVSYSTIFTQSFTLFRNGTYHTFAQGLFDRDNHWTFSKTTLRFRTGPYWSGFRHVTGSYHKAGSRMPHSQSHPSRRYSLILHDARRGDSDTLPRHGSADATLWYCKRR